MNERFDPNGNLHRIGTDQLSSDLILYAALSGVIAVGGSVGHAILLNGGEAEPWAIGVSVAAGVGAVILYARWQHRHRARRRDKYQRSIRAEREAEFERQIKEMKAKERRT